MGFLKKQEMRHKFKDKSFTQRIPVGAGWEYKQGPPMLYNLDKLQIADTIFMVEGPKDCETIARHIHDPFIVATTTGGAGTWVENLADDLVGKRVVLMPDNDTAGEAYADQIADTLTRRGIRFTRISFADENVKDASAYLVNHSIDDLLGKVGWFIPPEPEPVIQA
jgi:5S rRNA maturation endonuclease (ribonuclease M5)